MSADSDQATPVGPDGRADGQAETLSVKTAKIRESTILSLKERIELMSANLAPGAAAGAAGFNAAFVDDWRAARVFAFHLERLGVSRFLDIGSGVGEFARRMRRLGYGGEIYSVEPRSAAYTELLANAASDKHWLPLARQGAGAAPGFVDLVRQPPQAAYVASSPEQIVPLVPNETVYVTRACELLNAGAMGQIEAVRINAQGLEAGIVEGLAPLLGQVNLLTVDGASGDDDDGLFSLDALLVGTFGFTRATLEPALYDDLTGTANRYTAIYLRPEQTGSGQAYGVSISAVITSIGGAMKRLRGDGADVGEWWAGRCIESWTAFSSRVLSVSEVPPPGKTVTWSRCSAKPPVAELFRRMHNLGDGSYLLTNADVYLTDTLKNALPTLSPDVMYYGNRHEVQLLDVNSDRLQTTGYFAGGFDLFIMPSSFIRTINEHALIPDIFLVGEPWWDYLVPLLAVVTGFPCKKLAANDINVLHYSHAERSTMEQYLTNGQRFIDSVEKLNRSDFPYAKGFLAQLLDWPSTDFKARLWHVAERICYALP
jgi:FkbM family methyltransferase